jgi:hypothetical protein
MYVFRERDTKIPVGMASEDSTVEAIVHNSLHCCGEDYECGLPHCQEYTGGDHFLLKFLTDKEVEVARATSHSKIPRWWCCMENWHRGFDTLHGLLEHISVILRRSPCTEDGVAACRNTTRSSCQWLADTVGWMMLVLVALVCEGWVIPRAGGPSKKRKVGGVGLDDNSKSDATHGEKHVLQKLQDAVHAGSAPPSILTKCFKWLRPASPTPPVCLLIDGVLQDAATSHRAWCDQVSSQRLWPLPWDREYHQIVSRRVACELGRQ